MGEVHNTEQEAVNKTIPKKKKRRKVKWSSEEALQIAEEQKGVKSKGERETHIQLNARFQKIARRDKKAFFNEQGLMIEENNKRRKTRDLFQITGNIKGEFHPKMGIIKDKNGRGLIESKKIKKRWKEYTEKLNKQTNKKDLNELDYYDILVCHPEPDIMKCKVKSAL